MKVKKKKQHKLVIKREPRTRIISFRLREAETDLLEEDLKVSPVVGIKSLKQFARKLTIDYARQRLVYVRHVDRKFSEPESVKIEPPNCSMTDAKFVRELRKFIDDEENWRRLRFFMLMAGWPQRLAQAYRSTKDNRKRLRIAQQVLTNMLKN